MGRRDHPHHTSMWLAHGDVNGHDFWHSKGATPRVDVVGEPKVAVKAGVTTVDMIADWVAKPGEALLRDAASTLSEAGGVRHIDVDVRLEALVDVTFGDTKEGTFALRLHPALRIRGEVAKGKALDSEGRADRALWGKRSRWVAYHGPIDGQEVGVAIFDHPENPRHPTWWHARDYGLVGANPFGVHDFETKPAGTGDLELEKGEVLRMRYRVRLHSGPRTPGPSRPPARVVRSVGVEGRAPGVRRARLVVREDRVLGARCRRTSRSRCGPTRWCGPRPRAPATACRRRRRAPPASTSRTRRTWCHSSWPQSTPFSLARIRLRRAAPSTRKTLCARSSWRGREVHVVEALRRFEPEEEAQVAVTVLTPRLHHLEVEGEAAVLGPVEERDRARGAVRRRVVRLGHEFDLTSVDAEGVRVGQVEACGPAEQRHGSLRARARGDREECDGGDGPHTVSGTTKGSR